MVNILAVEVKLPCLWSLACRILGIFDKTNKICASRLIMIAFYDFNGVKSDMFGENNLVFLDILIFFSI